MTYLVPNFLVIELLLSNFVHLVKIPDEVCVIRRNRSDNKLSWQECFSLVFIFKKIIKQILIPIFISLLRQRVLGKVQWHERNCDNFQAKENVTIKRVCQLKVTKR